MDVFDQLELGEGNLDSNGGTGSSEISIGRMSDALWRDIEFRLIDFATPYDDHNFHNDFLLPTSLSTLNHTNGNNPTNYSTAPPPPPILAHSFASEILADAYGLIGYNIDYDIPQSQQRHYADFDPFSVIQTTIDSNQSEITESESVFDESWLRSVILSEDQEEDVIFCSICMDEMKLGEEAKQLPCRHRYHGTCITPWLKIRNTCPLCRSKLP